MDPKNEALKRRDAGEEEPLEGPHDHNYCEMTIGSSLGPEAQLDAYRIERKLGWGTCSTIWLALDTRCGEYVALKIMTAKVTKNMLNKTRNQIPFYIALDGEELAAVDTNHPGRKHCMHMLEAFIVERIYEDVQFEYAVCAFEVLGPDLTELQWDGVPPRIPIALVKLIVKQTLQALDYIHEECGIVHCDLRPDHISLGIGSTALVKETIKSLIEMKKPEFLEDGRPISQPLLMHTVCDKDDIFVKLTDFGNATWRDKPHRLPSGPLAYRSPEALLEHPDFGPATDIWSLGCIIFELLTGKRLFEQYDDVQIREEEAVGRHLASMRIYSQQFFPDFLREESFKGPRFLGSRSARIKEDNPCLEDAINKDGIFLGNETEIKQVEAFLRRCLILDPRYRPTAIELLKDSWLNDL